MNMIDDVTPTKPAVRRNKSGDPNNHPKKIKAKKSTLLLTASSPLQLGNINNPTNSDTILVVNSSNEQRDVANGEPINSGDTIVCQTGAYGELQDATGAMIASFADASPATVEIDWSEVLQVDEYYNGGSYSYDITVDDSGSDVITIQG